jgi:hypothetical protein
MTRLERLLRARSQIATLVETESDYRLLECEQTTVKMIDNLVDIANSQLPGSLQQDGFYVSAAHHAATNLRLAVNAVGNIGDALRSEEFRRLLRDLDVASTPAVTWRQPCLTISART